MHKVTYSPRWWHCPACGTRHQDAKGICSCGYDPEPITEEMSPITPAEAQEKTWDIKHGLKALGYLALAPIWLPVMFVWMTVEETIITFFKPNEPSRWFPEGQLPPRRNRV